MVLPEPTTLPTWAVLDQVDPTSNQNNVLTPPPQQQQYGWGFHEFPPRNWFNWLGRYTYQWLAYFKQQNPRSKTVITSAVQGGPSALPICDPSVNVRGITMIYINDVKSGNNSNIYIGMYIRNTTSSVAPQPIFGDAALLPIGGSIVGSYTLGTVDKTTGILSSVSSSLATPGPFNIVAVSYDTIL